MTSGKTNNATMTTYKHYNLSRHYNINGMTNGNSYANTIYANTTTTSNLLAPSTILATQHNHNMLRAAKHLGRAQGATF